MIFLWRKCDTQTQNEIMKRFLYLEIVSFKIEDFFAVSDGDHSGKLGSDPVDSAMPAFEGTHGYQTSLKAQISSVSWKISACRRSTLPMVGLNASCSKAV